jgi:hypothetical protein
MPRRPIPRDMIPLDTIPLDIPLDMEVPPMTHPIPWVEAPLSVARRVGTVTPMSSKTSC